MPSCEGKASLERAPDSHVMQRVHREAFATTMRELRESLGREQGSMAALLEVSQRTLSHWENQHGIPGVKERLHFLHTLHGFAPDYVETFAEFFGLSEHPGVTPLLPAEEPEAPTLAPPPPLPVVVAPVETRLRSTVIRGAPVPPRMRTTEGARVVSAGFRAYWHKPTHFGGGTLTGGGARKTTEAVDALPSYVAVTASNPSAFFVTGTVCWVTPGVIASVAGTFATFGELLVKETSLPLGAGVWKNSSSFPVPPVRRNGPLAICTIVA